jgi:hypothetical protein
MYKLYENEKAERKRFNDNYVAVLTDNSRQQTLTIKELRALYPKYDSLASELKIRTKYIKDITEISYKFRDTTITKSILKKDSISEKSYFVLNDKCYSFAGYTKKDSIAFTKKEFNDVLTSFVYKDWEKKYFFKLFKFKPYYKTKVFSKCMNDTISVNNHIQITK